MPASLQVGSRLRRSPWPTFLPAIFVALVAIAVGSAIFASAPVQNSSIPAPAGSAPPQSASAPPATPGPQGTPPLERGKRLVLTDGGYQLVREYERDGDRVRYYSLERSAWEEMPASLVDWAATEKADSEQKAAEKALDQKLAAADRAAVVAGIDSDRSFEARPGVILPDEVGLYIVAGSQSHALEQNQAVSHADTLRAAERIASGVPLIPTKAYIDIKPKHAKLRVRSGEMEFYFRPASGREPKLELLKANVESDRRKLGVVTTNFAGTNKTKALEIDLLTSEAARGLYRFTLDQDLMPGEYALVELLPDRNVDLYVWDFGVDKVSGNAGVFLHNVQAK